MLNLQAIINSTMDVSRIEAELYSLADKLNDRWITPRAFCDTFLDKIHPFVDRNSRTCKILFNGKIENFCKIYNFVSRNVIFSKLCSVSYKYD